MIEWLTGVSPDEQATAAEVLPTHTEKHRAEALTDHMPLPGTDVEVVAYPPNSQDVMLLANKGASASSGRSSSARFAATSTT
jgi:hypothetical protein